MRSLLSTFVLGAAALLGGMAQAGPLLAGQSSLTFTLGTNAPVVFPGDGTSAGTAMSPSDFTLAAGAAFAGTTTITLTPTAMQPLTKIIITIGNNAKGAFNGAPAAGTATFTGTAINKALGATILKVPIQLGKTGTVKASGSGIKVTATGKKWTSGMTTVDLGGGMSVMATGSLMAGTPGTAKLVAASKIVTNIGITTYAIGELALEYQSIPTPEPGLALLLVTGAATLGVVGSRRTRRR
jgi:hypothetical protein